MGAYPTSPRTAFLEWCQVHAPIFTANAAAIGLTPAQASAFAGATTTTAAASLAQEQARQAAKVATEVAGEAFGNLRTGAGDTVRLIRAFAEMQPKPSVVYNLAQIPPPQPPSTLPPPGQPTNLTVTLTPADGALTLRWKCTNPTGASGTSYIISRRLPGDPFFTFVGVSGKKQFVDDTLLAGPDSVQYVVQGQRADSSGPLSEVFTVNFGQAPGGLRMASVSGGASGGATFGTLDHAGETTQSGTQSTVNGRPVQKVLPNGNGRAKRAATRK